MCGDEPRSRAEPSRSKYRLDQIDERRAVLAPLDGTDDAADAHALAGLETAHALEEGFRTPHVDRVQLHPVAPRRDLDVALKRERTVVYSARSAHEDRGGQVVAHAFGGQPFVCLH